MSVPMIAVLYGGKQIAMRRETDAYCGRCPACGRDALLFRKDSRLWCSGCGFRAVPENPSDAYKAAFEANYGQKHDAR